MLWISGDREGAEAMASRALDRAEALEFPYGPFSAGYVHSLLAMTCRLGGDHAAAARHARAMIELGDYHGFVTWSLAGSIQTGLSSLHGGDASGLDAVLAGVGIWRDVLVAEVWMPYWLTELAAAERAVGRADEALQALDEALAVAARTGSDFYAAETLRVRGELRHERGDGGGIDDLRAALDKARDQQANAFELRAAMALARATSGTPDSRRELKSAIGRFAHTTHHDELDEARSLAAL
jgi:adenylate cyclase